MDDENLEARFGPWRLLTPLDNIVDAHITGPYGVLKTVGPAHLSLVDAGLTFATNGERGVCVEFAEPAPAIEPLGKLRHPALTVTVADCGGLVEELIRRSPARTDSQRLSALEAAVDDLRTMTAGELRSLADEHGITHTTRMSKAELLRQLESRLDAPLLEELDDNA